MSVCECTVLVLKYMRSGGLIRTESVSLFAILSINRKVAAVPESLLKKQKATEALAAKRAEERVATKKVYTLSMLDLRRLLCTLSSK